MENRRLRSEMEAVGGASFLGVMADEKVLDSIENAFRQFHAFLDLLREAGCVNHSVLNLSASNQARSVSCCRH